MGKVKNYKDLKKAIASELFGIGVAHGIPVTKALMSKTVLMLGVGVPFNKPDTDGMTLEEVIAFNNLPIEERKRQMEGASKPHPLAELFFRKIGEYNAVKDTGTRYLPLEDGRVMIVAFNRGWQCDIVQLD